ncbi:MAG: thiamine pyrophosphate-binding protein [Bacteroidales bacterium]|nr:thiamine pyrophosphate-binding protein [Lachnoclostridium sp.]MCM1383933.1 thiamine pyrophosphate-binding protein [Lachnoclostridium sp.]MCM1464642.1 thiamine pyrophosphate-binding protein [Bacteroidales bacterium]
MRVCDVIAKFILSTGVNEVFMFPGGGNKFLIDGLAANKNIKPVSCHHEQGVAMAAIGYAKYKGMAYGMVTTGCGGTNTITGVLNGWQDSTACMFISGQCHSKQLISCVDVPVRQVGIQEADIVTIVSSITKYAVMLTRAEDILYELEKAYYIAKEGRPGPVWLDVPLDIQAAEVDESTLHHFDAKEYKSQYSSSLKESDLDDIEQLLRNAKRPVILGGQGIRLSGATDLFEKLVEHLDIPAVFARLGVDALLTTSKYNVGVIGNHGNRSGNKALQNADVLLVLGSKLGINAVGYSFDLFAPKAKVIVVDIDANEHKKGTVHIDKFVQSDLKDFIQGMLKREQQKHSKWVDACSYLKESFPACTQEHYNDENGISMYAFVNELSKSLPEEIGICTDAGSAFFVTPQALILSDKKQRYITSGGQAEMGFTIPACVGVCFANGRKEVVGITGDGSFMLNMQELQTIACHQLPVKIFIWNNNGYMGIRQMQDSIFQNRRLGVDSENGLSFPDFEKLAQGFHIKYYCMNKIADMQKQLKEIHEYQGPVLCEVLCQTDEIVLGASTMPMPDGSKKQVLEDMLPHLDMSEFDKFL